jgi:hypothetical protein
MVVGRRGGLRNRISLSITSQAFGDKKLQNPLSFRKVILPKRPTVTGINQCIKSNLIVVTSSVINFSVRSSILEEECLLLICEPHRLAGNDAAAEALASK